MIYFYRKKVLFSGLFFQFLEVYGMTYIVERLIDFILYILNNALASELLFALNMSLLIIFSILSLIWIVRGCRY